MQIGDIVEQYITVRNAIAEKEAEFKAKMAPAKKLLEELEGLALQHFIDTKTDSFKTEAGTAYTVNKTSATMADWPLFWDWIQEDLDSRTHFLEQRVSKSAVENYISEAQAKELEQELPPGINWRVERSVNFMAGRKAKPKTAPAKEAA